MTPEFPMRRWYTLHVKPHKERTVAEYLTQQRVPVFPALVRVQPKNPRAARWRPYFPGYVFVQVDLSDVGAGYLDWLTGAYGLVRFGGEPAVVPETLVGELRRRLQALNAGGGWRPDDLRAGERVRIVQGPFQGYEAIFDERLPGKDRVQVLLAFLSHYPQRVQLDSADIEKL